MLCFLMKFDKIISNPLNNLLGVQIRSFSLKQLCKLFNKERVIFFSIRLQILNFYFLQSNRIDVVGNMTYTDIGKETFNNSDLLV